MDFQSQIQNILQLLFIMVVILCTLRMRYIGRRVNYFDLCHMEAMSIIKVNDMFNKLGMKD